MKHKVNKISVFLMLYVAAKPVWDVIHDSYGIIIVNLLITIPLALQTNEIKDIGRIK